MQDGLHPLSKLLGTGIATGLGALAGGLVLAHTGHRGTAAATTGLVAGTVRVFGGPDTFASAIDPLVRALLSPPSAAYQR